MSQLKWNALNWKLREKGGYISTDLGIIDREEASSVDGNFESVRTGLLSAGPQDSSENLVGRISEEFQGKT